MTTRKEPELPPPFGLVNALYLYEASPGSQIIEQSDRIAVVNISPLLIKLIAVTLCIGKKIFLF